MLNPGFSCVVARIAVAFFLLIAATVFVIAASPALAEWLGISRLGSVDAVASEIRHYLFIATPLAILAAILASGTRTISTVSCIAFALAATLIFLPWVPAWFVIALIVGILIKPNGTNRFPVLTAQATTSMDTRGLPDEIWVCVLAAAGIGLRLLSFEEPFERDLMIYATVAEGWLRGMPLYSEMWDHKPPAVHVAYAAAIAAFGLNPLAIFALNCTAFLATLFGIYVAATKLGGPIAALPAVLIWLVIGTDPLMQANQPNVEVFLNASLVWALALVLPGETATKVRHLYLAGILLFIATAFKQVAVFYAFSIAIALVLAALDRGEVSATIRRVGVAFGAVGLIGWTAIFAFFFLRGEFDAFWFAAFEYNQAYAGSIWRNWAAALHRFDDFQISRPYAVFFFAAATFHACHWRSPNHRIMLAAYIGAFLASAAPGRLYWHYFQLLMPCLAISGGYIAAFIVPRFIRILTVTSGLAWAAVSIGYLNSDQLVHVKYGSGGSALAAVSSKELGSLLRNHPELDGKIYHWGTDPGVYFWQGGGTPVGLTYHIPLLHPSKGAMMEQKLLKDLRLVEPVIVVAREEILNREDEVTGWIKHCYSETSEFGSFDELTVLRRNEAEVEGC